MTQALVSFPSLPGQKWYYNSNDGAVEQHEPVTFIEAHLPWLGWHGPFDTKQQALDFYNQNKAANPKWHAPSGLAQQFKEIPQTAATGVSNAASEVFHGLNLETWILRIGEIVLGLVLVGVAIAHLTGTDNIISKAVKVGKFL